MAGGWRDEEVKARVSKRVRAPIDGSLGIERVTIEFESPRRPRLDVFSI